MLGGHLDALANIEPVITMLVRGGKVVEEIETISEQGAKDLYGAALPSGSLYTKHSFIRKNPNTIQALANAMVRAVKWLAEASDELVADTVPPQDIMKKNRWKIPLGGPNSEVKQKIFGLNSAHLYNLDIKISSDKPFRKNQTLRVFFATYP